MARNTRYSVIAKGDITSEKLLARIWQRQHLKSDLSTTDGESLKVIFPGRLNGLGGPDFRRAILATGQGQLRGDVELHLRSSLWRDHGHHRDPAYNSVVLHVVMWHDSPVPIYLHNGKQVPTLALAPYVLRREKRQKPAAREPCRQPGRRLDSTALGQLLDLLGDLRFKARVDRFRDRLAKEDPAQVLYEGIMEALGYSRNQEAFKELAKRLPLTEAEAMVRDVGWEPVYSLLLCRGGLDVTPLTSRIPYPDVRGVRRDMGPALTTPDKIRWQQQGVRPVNQPARRILAISHLLERYSKEGLLTGLMAAVVRAAQGGGQSALEAALTVPTSNEQGAMAARKGEPALLGRERAGEIGVNILLPFAFAWGLENQALELYRGFKPLPDNEITREMSELLGLYTKPRYIGARRQQGLIHLFKLFCGERRCQECPVGS